MRIARMIGRTALAIGLTVVAVAPVTATELTGDLVEVVTDSTTYSSSSPILVWLKYSNFGDEQQQISLASGMFDAVVYVNRVGVEGDNNAFSGKMALVNPSLNAAVIWGHSSAVLGSITIAPYKLTPGIYEVGVQFNFYTATTPPQRILGTVPRTLIQVR